MNEELTCKLCMKAFRFQVEKDFILMRYTISTTISSVNVVKTVNIGKIMSLDMLILNYLITFLIVIKKILVLY